MPSNETAWMLLWLNNNIIPYSLILILEAACLITNKISSVLILCNIIEFPISPDTKISLVFSAVIIDIIFVII